MFRRKLLPRTARGPLRVMFVITSMPVGGMESLLVELLRRIDRRRMLPELCCLKNLDVLGEVMAREVRGHYGVIAQKYDVRVLWRLTRLMRRREIDAVITVGTGGDKMFWGRLAGWLAGVPVIGSALHSTGLPDRVDRLNRLLTPLTDVFIAVAEPHARYLAEHEGCPAARIRVIPNGVDVGRFRPRESSAALRQELGLPADAPVVGIVAALRPEKNHEMFLRAAKLVCEQLPNAQFLIVGDGPRRPDLESLAGQMSLSEFVHFLGTRKDVPEVLNCFDVFALTSHMEANPVSILEAMACGKPVVAPRVGSVPETVKEDVTGYLVPAGDAAAMAQRIVQLMSDPQKARRIGCTARENVIANWSVERMVRGYEEMICEIYDAKARPAASSE